MALLYLVNIAHRGAVPSYRWMTRINVVPVEELSRQHLIAEYRELPRIFALVRAAEARGELPEDRRNPICYTLGTGHCRFFYPRLTYLVERQRALIAEMKRRGYVPNFEMSDDLLRDIPEKWFQDWIPDDVALEINRARIRERS
jgi:deoxyribonuclease (pyrimidine dimer)